MMFVRPVDMPLLRDETAETILRVGPEMYEQAIRDGRQFMRPMMSPTRGANLLTSAEITRLKAAELFYVNEDMTDLAIAAAGQMPDFNLMPEDLPAPSGMILFQKPLDQVDYGEYYANEGASPIVAAAWSHWGRDLGWDWESRGHPHQTQTKAAGWDQGGIWVSWYADRDGMIANARARGLGSEDQLQAMRTGAGRLLPDNETQCPFTSEPLALDPQDPSRSPAEASGIVRWLTVLKATWLLMSQPLASVRDAQYDRAARRRIERTGQEPPRVRVITLRRSASTSDGASDREFHHQWIVRGHWRQQWYPARQVHRPVWIAPHVKGPEGAPMLGGEKVYAWQR